MLFKKKKTITLVDFIHLNIFRREEKGREEKVKCFNPEPTNWMKIWENSI